MTRSPPAVARCRWIAVPGAADVRGRINFLETGKDLPFAPQRLFWLHGVAAGQWRGRHAHRRTELLIVALHGACQVQLDDGRTTDTGMLDDPALALHVGTWVWHELTDFSPGAAVLAIASTRYEEAEYLRDYQTFKREVAGGS
jgi:hypothetical protein